MESPQHEYRTQLSATNANNAPARACLQGEVITFTVRPIDSTVVTITSCTWSFEHGRHFYPHANPEHEAVWDTTGVPPGREHTISVLVRYLIRDEPASEDHLHMAFFVQDPATQPQVAAIRGIANSAVGEIKEALGAVSVGMRRTTTPLTSDLGLWMWITRTARALSFTEYSRAMDWLLLGAHRHPSHGDGHSRERLDDDMAYLRRRRFLPFNDTDAYRYLKIGTEAFLLSRIGVARHDPDHDAAVQLADVFDISGSSPAPPAFTAEEIEDAADALSARDDPKAIREALRHYLRPTTVEGRDVWTLPYLALVRERLQDAGVKNTFFFGDDERTIPRDSYDILEEKLTQPVLLELIWSYWQEEGMLVQTMNAISRRFQNMHGPGDRDPLYQMEIDPLRPLNNVLWGYVQDEPHRLSIMRRVAEYKHQYGCALTGLAGGPRRHTHRDSRFVEAFHNLLFRTRQFFQQDDDTTVVSDGFPILNALREVHLVLSETAANQFGDLASTARQEMLMQHWILARPEFQQFLPTRAMVAYPEPWMGRVDAMKGLQGWSQTSVMQFHNLAMYGEQILLSIRYGNWSNPNLSADHARNWARFFRKQIYGYLHSYLAVTGVDLSLGTADRRVAADRALQPAPYVRRQLDQRRARVVPEPAYLDMPAFAGPAPTPNGVAQPRIARRPISN